MTNASFIALSMFLFAIAACERRVDPRTPQPQNPPQTQTAIQPQKQLHAPADTHAKPATSQSMPNPKAIIVVWIGPSDRPTPPTIFWSEKAALESATAWIVKRGNAPIGVSAVETNADDLPCMARAVPPSSGRCLLEVSAWDGTSASSHATLDPAGARAFLAGATSCVGDNSPATGYLKSLQTLVNNAAR